MTDIVSDDLPKYAFLRGAAASVGRWRGLFLTLAMGGLAAVFAIGLASLAVFGIGSAIFSASSSPHLDLLQAFGVLTNVGRADRSLVSYVFELSLVGLSSYAGALAFLAVAAWVERRPVRSFLTAAPRFRWRQIGLGLVVFLPIVGLAIGLTNMLDPHPPTPPLFTPGASASARLIYFAAALVFLYLAALSEEMLFRGWALQRTSAFTKNIPIVLAVNGVLFSLAHFDPDLGAFVIRVVMGAGWAWIVLRLAGVELAAGAHLANNLAICLFNRPVVLTPPPKQPFDIVSVGVELASIALLVIAVELALRRWPRLSVSKA